LGEGTTEIFKLGKPTVAKPHLHFDDLLVSDHAKNEYIINVGKAALKLDKHSTKLGGNISYD